MVYLPAVLARDVLDQQIRHVMVVLVQSKAMTLFALLFGMGMALQFAKPKANQFWFRRMYRRRLWLLMLFGAIHGFVLWYGDILLLYSISGFIAMAFLRMNPRKQRIWAIGLFAANILIIAAFMNLKHLNPEQPLPTSMPTTTQATPAPATTQTIPATQPTTTTTTTTTTSAPAYSEWQFKSEEQMWDKVTEVERKAYREGGWKLLFVTRGVTFLGMLISSIFMFLPWALGAFVLGQSFIKGRLISQQEDRSRTYARMGRVGLLLGLPLVIAGRAVEVAQIPSFWVGSLGQVAFSTGSLAMALGYMGLIAWLAVRSLSNALTQSLAAVGRMAFTNYITHTIVCTTIFYFYGLALFDKLSYPQALVIALVIFAVQLLVCPIWLKYFHFGPLEWLWRSGMYRRWQPFLRKTA
jgi:uncharacterized protein